MPSPHRRLSTCKGVEKNFQKWYSTKPFGSVVEGTNLMPTKIFSTREEHGHTLHSFLRLHPEVKTIIDLSSEPDPYEVDPANIDYVKLSTISKQIPTELLVNDFISNVRGRKGIVAIHCHYGFNRTGFVICAYLCRVLNLSPDDAIDRFKKARPPGIKHAHFIDALRQAYAKS